MENKIDLFMVAAKGALAPGLTRLSLEGVLGELVSLAADGDQWSSNIYPDPAPDEHQARYLVREDRETGHTLYLNVMRPGKKIPPHDHTTWACIAAVSGLELNTIYERTDGGIGPGSATIQPVRKIDISPGSGMALMPEDIHSVEISGDSIIRHLHFYGAALERLSERLMYDVSTNTAKVMTLTVKTKS